MSDREIINAKRGVKKVHECHPGGKVVIFRDAVVERVVDKFVERSNVGFEKYGRTLHNERTGKHKDLAGYLNDIQEELMDAILYIQAAREELDEHGS